VIWNVLVAHQPRAVQHQWCAMAAAATHRGGLKMVLQWVSSDMVNFYMGGARWGTHRRVSGRR
jgi:hypothetical protein